MMVELLGFVVMAIFIALILLRSLRNSILRMLATLYVLIALMYYLWGYTISELILTLTLCSVSIIGIASALQVVSNGVEPALHLELPKIERVAAILYRGLYLYVILLVGSTSITSLLSTLNIGPLHRLGIAIALSVLAGYIVKRMRRGVWIALTIFILLATLAYLIDSQTLLSDLRSLDEVLRLLDLVVGSVG
ncbi:MAG TPA: hypothetical protein EYP48_00265 [Ignisphaera sp.]|uniref:Uncharacterized protein n=1 Tax=Ignisphaera aggregans TaxID=334771 RepID=A0A832YYZ9_9CREN|nr:hypothetical protein [Ignisphaera sp.]HIP56732.1 hypothetical protein [Ignisphaera aggregans]